LQPDRKISLPFRAYLIREYDRTCSKMEKIKKIYFIDLHSGDVEKLHTFVSRIFCVYQTHAWFVYGLRSDVLNPYTLKLILTVMPKAFIFFVLGLWLSTTEFGKRNKKTTYVLLAPSLLMSPAIAGFPASIMGWLSFFVAVWSYVTINRAKVRN
jgi:hypothetical protein